MPCVSPRARITGITSCKRQRKTLIPDALFDGILHRVIPAATAVRFFSSPYMRLAQTRILTNRCKFKIAARKSFQFHPIKISSSGLINFDAFFRIYRSRKDLMSEFIFISWSIRWLMIFKLNDIECAESSNLADQTFTLSNE